MRHLLTCVVLTTFACALATSPPHPCACWAGWQPVSEGNNQYHCENSESKRIFQCNIDQPPVCICKEKATEKDDKLPLGETNCVGIDFAKYKDRDCEPRSEWNAWFKKYPQFRLVD